MSTAGRAPPGSGRPSSPPVASVTRFAQTAAEIVGVDVEGLADALEGEERVAIPRLHPGSRLVEQEPRGRVAGPVTPAIAVEGVLEYRQHEQALALHRLASGENALLGEEDVGLERGRRVCGPVHAMTSPMGSGRRSPARDPRRVVPGGKARPCHDVRAGAGTTAASSRMRRVPAGHGPSRGSSLRIWDTSRPTVRDSTSWTRQTMGRGRSAGHT